MNPDKIYLALLEDVGRVRDTCFQRGVSAKDIHGFMSYGAYRILAQHTSVATGTTFTLPETCTIMDVVLPITAHPGIVWCLKIPEGA